MACALYRLFCSVNDLQVLSKFSFFITMINLILTYAFKWNHKLHFNFISPCFTCPMHYTPRISRYCFIIWLISCKLIYNSLRSYALLIHLAPSFSLKHTHTHTLKKRLKKDQVRGENKRKEVKPLIKYSWSFRWSQLVHSVG